MQPSDLRDTTRLLPDLKAGVSDVEKSVKDLIDLAIDIVENSFGIKAVELVIELSKRNYSLDEITAVLEELETSDKVSVLTYTIPNKTSNEKIMFFPKGTKILTFT